MSRRLSARRDAYPTAREQATTHLRWVLFFVLNARLKEAVGDTGNYARFDWQGAWDHMAAREGIS